MARTQTGVRPRRSYKLRFWDHVVTGPGCWGWTAATDKDGYGLLTISAWESDTDHRRNVRAPRVSWEIHNGPIPEGMWVLHRCDTPPCTNPECLYLGTVAENNADKRTRKRSQKSRWAHCLKGHEFTEANTRIRKDGCRVCRECARLAALAYYHRDKEAG